MPEKDQKERRYPYLPDDAELRVRLTPIQYAVTQNAATEPAFTGPDTEGDNSGVYHCVVCATPLFASAAKYHSGCGWPSYFQPINGEVIERKMDHTHGMTRVEVRCNQCGAHLGHVFEDGPQDKTGLRYCINSAALNFTSQPAEE